MQYFEKCHSKDNPESKRVMLALYRLPGMGPVKLANILQHFETPIQTELFDSSDNCRVFKGKADWAAVDRDLAWAEAKDCHILCRTDQSFPRLLKEIHAAPQVLYVRGNLEYLNRPTLAIVGSRNPSYEGLKLAQEFAQHFALLGFTVVSGLAEGIDGSAHKGALAGGATIAVLGNGLDTIYPGHHRDLAYEITLNGALLSEFPLGTPPIHQNFPRRNRIISGLSLGVVVIEAALKSGSLITAQYALEHNREVFAVPGSIHSTLSKGCHALIRQGAKLVETAEHVLEELGEWENFFMSPQVPQVSNSEIKRIPEIRTEKFATKSKHLNVKLESLNLEYRTLLDKMGHTMIPVDVLIERSQLTASQISSMLLELEIQGYVKSVQGGYIRTN